MLGQTHVDHQSWSHEQLIPARLRGDVWVANTVGCGGRWVSPATLLFSSKTAMSHRRILSWWVFVVLIGHSACALAEPGGDEKIRDAIERLGSGQQAVRQQAVRELWEAGLAAEPALRRAAESQDAEVRYRARLVLDKFRFGIFADTPPEVVASIRQFQQFPEGELSNRYEILRKLQLQGQLRTVLMLLKADENDDRLRKMYLTSLGLEPSGAIPYLLRQGDFERAEKWLEEIADTDPGANAIAAYWLMRGKLDERIDKLRAELTTDFDTRTSRSQAYLLRAKGDWPAARIAAEQSGDAPIIKAVLVELQDWEEIARRHEQQRPPDNRAANQPGRVQLKRLGNQQAAAVADMQMMTFLGYAAAYQRLAGHAEEAAARIAEATTLAKNNPENQWHGMKTLLINDRPEEAIALVRDDCPAVAFGLLAFQHRYREAFEVAGLTEGREPNREWFLSLKEEMSGRAPKKTSRYDFALEVARLFYALGKRDESQKLFALLAELAQESELEKKGDETFSDGNHSLWLQLASAEFKIGLTQPAFEHAARAAERLGPRPVLDQFFGTRASEANVWWQFFRRQQPEEPAPTTLQRIFHVLLWINSNEDAPPLAERNDGDFRKLVAAALQVTAELDERERLAWRLDLGETCLDRKQYALARECFHAVADGSAEAMLRLADAFYLDQQWDAAASWYRRAWEKDFYKLIALFMAGRSLEKAGHADEGRELVRQANLLAIGSPARHALAKALSEREMNDDAIEQFRIFQRSQPTAMLTAEVHDAARRLAFLLQKNDRLRTSEMWQRVIVGNLEWGWYFNEAESYLRVPSYVHRYRAHGLIEAGKIDEALREAALARVAAPTDVSLAEDVVPALEKAGRKPDADELFDKMFATLDQLSREFPHSGGHHNDLSWLAARCHRRLDDALTHAQRAVELAPHNAGYLDTLAEAHFHLGHREKAIELEEKCVAMNPRMKTFQEQLARFRNEPLP